MKNGIKVATHTMDATTKPVQPNFKELINLYLKLSFFSKSRLQVNGAIKEAHINVKKKSIKLFIYSPNTHSKASILANDFAIPSHMMLNANSLPSFR